MKIADNKGVWLINRGQFRFVDGENGTIFEPGEPTKALRTQWVKDQSVIVRCADPTSEDPEAAQAELAELIEQDKAERDQRQAKAEEVMAKDNAAMNAVNAAILNPTSEDNPAGNPDADPAGNPDADPAGNPDADPEATKTPAAPKKK